MTDTPASEPEDVTKFNWLLMLPTLIFDVALPVILFNVLTRYGVPTFWALVIGGLSPAFNNVRVWITSRRRDPLGIIVMTLLVISAGASFISGNVFFVLVKDSVLTSAFGIICLATLFMSRPLMFTISRQFVAGEDPARIAWWNSLWEFPSFRSGMRLVTAVWGVVYILEAFIRVGLVLTLTPAQVVTISPIMGFGATILLIIFTRRYMLMIRDRGVRARQAAEAAQSSQ
jgi:hypothetical protein